MNSLLKTLLRKQLVLLFLLITSFYLHAQNNNSYSLLWKIEGKGLKKPSYIFGTMHIDDIRAFNFSDAVLPAIESSEKFALEVQPDSILESVLNPKEKNTQKAYLKFKDLLDDKDYKKLSKRFFDVNGYVIEESEETDPDSFIFSLNPNEDKETDKSNFVDFHLLAHAKTMRKDVIGLESIDDQMNTFKNLTESKQKEYILDYLKYDIEDYKKNLEEMTKIYISGDINRINNYLIENKCYDLQLERRNKVMCKSIISVLAKNESLFSAVGAAHLPGKNGLIKLLRAKGYKVTAVEASFTGVKELYKIDTSKMKWNTFKDSNLGYSVKVPSRINTDSTNIININISVDLTNLKCYTFYGLDVREKKKNEDDSTIIARIINKNIEQYKAIETKRESIILDNVSGYLVTMQLDKNQALDSGYSTIKSAYVAKNDIFYQFIILGNPDNIESSSSKKFFNSVKFQEPKPLPKTKPADWINYINDTGAFSIEIPTEPKDLSRKAEILDSEGKTVTYDLNIFFASDIKNNRNYLFRYNDLPLGYKIEDIEASYKEMSKAFLTQAKIIGTPKDIIFKGLKAKEYELLINNKYPSLCILFFRGNRTYLLLSQSSKFDEKISKDERFFNNFKLLDYKDSNLISITEDSFSFNFFKKNKIDIDNEDYSESYIYNSKDYYTKDDNNGNVYTFGFSKLKPYIKIDSLSTIYDNIVNDFKGWNDSIVSKEHIKIKNKNALEFRLYNKKSKFTSRHIQWLDNDFFFIASAYTSKESIESKTTNTILKSYLPIKNNKTIDYYTSKTDRIITDLKSKDSIVFKDAIGAFSYYEFNKKDLPKLYKAVDKEYSSLKNKALVTQAIVNELNNINDENTIPFLKAIYLRKNTPDDLKASIIRSIPKLDYENNISVYKSLFFNTPPIIKTNYPYRLFAPLYDSIPLAIDSYTELLKLNTITNYRKQILDISTRILNSTYNKKNVALSNFKNINKNANEDLADYLSMLNEKEYNYSKHALIYNYLNYYKATANKIDSVSTGNYIDAFTSSLIKANSNTWLSSKAAETRIIHGYKLPKELKKQLLDSMDTRMGLMKAYYKVKTFKKVPKKYKSIDEYVNLSLQEYLESSEEYPTKKELLGQLKIDKKTYYVHNLIYNYENEVDDTSESYLIVTEIDDAVYKKEELKPYPVYTNWEKTTNDWKAQAKALIVETIKNNEN